MNIAFRLDSSIEIGSGHLVRCLTLAKFLRKKGVNSVFFCQELDGNFSRLIAENNFSTNFIGGRKAPLDWAEDAELTRVAIDKSNLQYSWVIVDHYKLDASWEERLRSTVDHIMVIDDIANRRHNCEILLDQNHHPDPIKRYAKLVSKDCRFLLGPKYALLRDEFAKTRDNLPKRVGRLKHVLISFGGIDLPNQTARAIEAISKLGRLDLETDVIVTELNPHIEQIQAICSKLSNVTVYDRVSNMAEVMAKADLSLGAGGSTMWERCSLGLPTSVVSIADNQTQVSEYAAKVGYARYLGTSDVVTPQTYISELLHLSAHSEILAAMSKKALSLVDGKGTERVANELLAA